MTVTLCHVYHLCDFVITVVNEVALAVNFAVLVCLECVMFTLLEKYKY